ncbi:VLRF1 family aeRF1-type release factor [Paenibacillus sp. FA6]|uniref:VLRF1 family aeRF1-type release factor n=1 Tax=Paenibacillus sp. FA6 TaxID=3413029 RepID=UPI003F655416
MNFEQNLTILKKRTFSPERKVLTVYLNTEPERSQQASFKIRLKNGLNRLIEYTTAEGALEESEQLSHIQTLLEKTLEEHRVDLKKGLVIVACPSEGILFLEKLQISTPNDFYWQEEPNLDALDVILNEYPAAGIILMGSESVTVLDTLLGGIKREWNYEWDISTEDWHQYEGVAGSSREASRVTHRDKFDKRIDANRQHWMKRLGPILERHKQRNNWKEIVLAGESALTAELTKELNSMKPRILSKNLKGMTNNQVLQEVYA